MNAAKPLSAAPDLVVTHVLAELLERLERSPLPVDAAQYRSVVLHLVDEFAGSAPNDTVRALLGTHPAAAELYENLNYQYAGLCLSPLELATRAEMQARQAIERAMRGGAKDKLHGKA